MILLTGASCDENNNIFDGGGADNGDDMLNGDGPDNGGGLPTPSPKPVLNFTGIGIDYDPEARCSDNNWSTDFPVACNPQLSFICPTGEGLSLCPMRCQACYDSDLDTIKNNLSVDTITIYQPNYYILTAAKAKGVKTIQ